MAIRNITTVGDEVLRKVSKPVTKFDKTLWQILDDMADTLAQSNGVGIAAPQIGILRRAFIVDYEGTHIECVNPKIIKQSGECIDSEGCLSVPNKVGEVKRPKTITIVAQNRVGDEFELTVSDYYARIFCHENDHLDGILFIDKVVEK